VTLRLLIRQLCVPVILQPCVPVILSKCTFARRCRWCCWWQWTWHPNNPNNPNMHCGSRHADEEGEGQRPGIQSPPNNPNTPNNPNNPNTHWAVKVLYPPEDFTWEPVASLGLPRALALARSRSLSLSRSRSRSRSLSLSGPPPPPPPLSNSSARHARVRSAPSIWAIKDCRWITRGASGGRYALDLLLALTCSHLLALHTLPAHAAALPSIWAIRDCRWTTRNLLARVWLSADPIEVGAAEADARL
jgi:hypothetical protein